MHWEGSGRRASDRFRSVRAAAFREGRERGARGLRQAGRVDLTPPRAITWPARERSEGGTRMVVMAAIVAARGRCVKNIYAAVWKRCNIRGARR